MQTQGCLVRGTTRRRGGREIAEARVFFTEAPVPVPDVATLTNDSGGFTLYAPAPGLYVVSCHAEGLSPASLSIDIAAWTSEVHIEIEMTATAR
jgi:hypothetical protein